MYVYGKRQQPLSIEDATLRATDGGSGTVVLAPDGRIYVATIVHNDGTFPITLLGLDDAPPPHDQPYAATSVGLGDGSTANPASAASFTSVSLKPGAGVADLRRLRAEPRGWRARDTPTRPGLRRPSHRYPFDSAPTGWRRSRRWRSRAPRRSRGSRARSASAHSAPRRHDAPQPRRRPPTAAPRTRPRAPARPPARRARHRDRSSRRRRR